MYLEGASGLALKINSVAGNKLKSKWERICQCCLQEYVEALLRCSDVFWALCLYWFVYQWKLSASMLSECFVLPVLFQIRAVKTDRKSIISSYWEIRKAPGSDDLTALFQMSGLIFVHFLFTFFALWYVFWDGPVFQCWEAWAADCFHFRALIPCSAVPVYRSISDRRQPAISLRSYWRYFRLVLTLSYYRRMDRL